MKNTFTWLKISSAHHGPIIAIPFFPHRISCLSPHLASNDLSVHHDIDVSDARKLLFIELCVLAVRRLVTILFVYFLA